MFKKYFLGIVFLTATLASIQPATALTKWGADLPSKSLRCLSQIGRLPTGKLNRWNANRTITVTRSTTLPYKSSGNYYLNTRFIVKNGATLNLNGNVLCNTMNNRWMVRLLNGKVTNGMIVSNGTATHTAISLESQYANTSTEQRTIYDNYRRGKRGLALYQTGVEKWVANDKNVVRKRHRWTVDRMTFVGGSKALFLYNHVNKANISYNKFYDQYLSIYLDVGTHNNTISRNTFISTGTIKQSGTRARISVDSSYGNNITSNSFKGKWNELGIEVYKNCGNGGTGLNAATRLAGSYNNSITYNTFDKYNTAIIVGSRLWSRAYGSMHRCVTWDEGSIISKTRVYGNRGSNGRNYITVRRDSKTWLSIYRNSISRNSGMTVRDSIRAASRQWTGKYPPVSVNKYRDSRGRITYKTTSGRYIGTRLPSQTYQGRPIAYKVAHYYDSYVKPAPIVTRYYKLRYTSKTYYTYVDASTGRYIAKWFYQLPKKQGNSVIKWTYAGRINAYNTTPTVSYVDRYYYIYTGWSFAGTTRYYYDGKTGKYIGKSLPKKEGSKTIRWHRVYSISR